MKIITMYRSDAGDDYDSQIDCEDADRRLQQASTQTNEFHHNGKSLYDCWLEISPKHVEYLSDESKFVMRHINESTKLFVPHWTGYSTTTVEFSHFLHEKYVTEMIFVDPKDVLGPYSNKISPNGLVRYYEATFGEITEEQLKETV